MNIYLYYEVNRLVLKAIKLRKKYIIIMIIVVIFIIGVCVWGKLYKNLKIKEMLRMEEIQKIHEM